MNFSLLEHDMKDHSLSYVLKYDPETKRYLAEERSQDDRLITTFEGPTLEKTLGHFLYALAPDKTIFCGWDADDVLSLDDSLSRDDALGVLKLWERKGDANVGFSWDTLQYFIDLWKTQRARP